MPDPEINRLFANVPDTFGKNIAPDSTTIADVPKAFVWPAVTDSPNVAVLNVPLMVVVPVSRLLPFRETLADVVAPSFATVMLLPVTTLVITGDRELSARAIVPESAIATVPELSVKNELDVALNCRPATLSVLAVESVTVPPVPEPVPKAAMSADAPLRFGQAMFDEPFHQFVVVVFHVPEPSDGPEPLWLAFQV